MRGNFLSMYIILLFIWKSCNVFKALNSLTQKSLLKLFAFFSTKIWYGQESVLDYLITRKLYIVYVLIFEILRSSSLQWSARWFRRCFVMEQIFVIDVIKNAGGRPILLIRRLCRVFSFFAPLQVKFNFIAPR